MTHFTKTLFLILLGLGGCATAVTAPLPERTYDFAARDVTGEVHAAAATSSPKAQLRAALEQLQPELARCTRGTSGTIDLTLRIVVDAGAPAALDSAELEYPDAGAIDCIGQAVADIDLSHVSSADSAIWVVHAPFVASGS